MRCTTARRSTSISPHAAAGAAIGFALTLTQTQAAHLERVHIPLAAAVICWALSFYAGCRQSAFANSVLYENAELLRVEAGRHPLSGDHPGQIEVGREIILQSIERDNKRAHRYAIWQFRLLVAGGLWYIVWHIVQMYVRTP